MDNSKKDIVFIIDDNPENIKVLGSLLDEKGYEPVVFLNAKIALESIRTKKPEIILLDIMMPEMDGYEMCQILKDDASFKDIPVIFLTGKTDTEDLVKGFDLGAADYVKKPFEFAELLARIKTHIDFKKAREEIKTLNQRLEDKVNERTAELEEMNAALKVLLKKNEKDMIEIEEKIISNYESLILPFIRKLKETLPEKKQESLVDIIEFNLKKVTSTFLKKLNAPMKHLTPAEIQIASMIKQGLTNKEIANVLDNSVRTVTNHRESIRQKLNLKNTKINLRSFLSSL
ncbi:MAG: response regulator [Deltaproteobacteria bacterium]|nr:response regulator [Deltaproteobacteria bacterium]